MSKATRAEAEVERAARVLERRSLGEQYLSRALAAERRIKELDAELQAQHEINAALERQYLGTLARYDAVVSAVVKAAQTANVFMPPQPNVIPVPASVEDIFRA